MGFSRQIIWSKIQDYMGMSTRTVLAKKSKPHFLILPTAFEFLDYCGCCRLYPKKGQSCLRTLRQIKAAPAIRSSQQRRLTSASSATGTSCSVWRSPLSCTASSSAKNYCWRELAPELREPLPPSPTRSSPNNSSKCDSADSLTASFHVILHLMTFVLVLHDLVQ